MKYDGRKIANSFYLPKHPFLRGIARLVDFNGAMNRDIFAQVLDRSDADSIRADWEAVGESMRLAIKEYARDMRNKDFSGSRIAS